MAHPSGDLRPTSSSVTADLATRRTPAPSAQRCGPTRLLSMSHQLRGLVRPARQAGTTIGDHHDTKDERQHTGERGVAGRAEIVKSTTRRVHWFHHHETQCARRIALSVQAQCIPVSQWPENATDAASSSRATTLVEADLARGAMYWHNHDVRRELFLVLVGMLSGSPTSAPQNDMPARGHYSAPVRYDGRFTLVRLRWGADLPALGGRFGVESRLPAR
jgi:hypothetical protein